MAKTEAEQLVDRFMATWERGDVDEMVEFFADDAVYCPHMPMEPVVGKAAIRTTFAEAMGAMEGLRFDLHRQVSDGTSVMQERTDDFSVGGQAMSLPICGVFEVSDGHITAWREYCDMTPFAAFAG